MVALLVVLAATAWTAYDAVNYTHNALDTPPRRYDANIAPTPQAVAWLGAPAWDAPGPNQQCGKGALVPPTEAPRKGVSIPSTNGFQCYHGYGILSKFYDALSDFEAYSGIARSKTGEFVKHVELPRATQAACQQACKDDPTCKATTLNWATHTCTLFCAPPTYRDMKKHLFDCALLTPATTLCVLWGDHLEVGLPPFSV